MPFRSIQLHCPPILFNHKETWNTNGESDLIYNLMTCISLEYDEKVMCNIHSELELYNINSELELCNIISELEFCWWLEGFFPEMTIADDFNRQAISSWRCLWGLFSSIQWRSNQPSKDQFTVPLYDVRIAARPWVRKLMMYRLLIWWAVVPLISLSIFRFCFNLFFKAIVQSFLCLLLRHWLIDRLVQSLTGTSMC